jgi:hypothetical protein
VSAGALARRHATVSNTVVEPPSPNVKRPAARHRPSDGQSGGVVT